MSINDDGQEGSESLKANLDLNKVISVNSLKELGLLSGKDRNKKTFIRSYSPVLLASMNPKEGKAIELVRRSVDLLEILWEELDSRDYCE